MGLHDLCNECQRLSRATPVQVSQEDAKALYLPTSVRGVEFEFYVFQDPGSATSLDAPANSATHPLASAKEKREAVPPPCELSQRSALAEHGIEQMRERSQGGCHLCTLLLEWNETDREDWMEKVKGGLVHGMPVLRVQRGDPLLDDDPDQASSLNIYIFSDKVIKRSTLAYPNTSVRTDLSRASLLSKEDQFVHGFRKTSIRGLRKRIQECMHSGQCRISLRPDVRGDSVPLPTRLLKICALEGKVDEVRLVETRTMPASVGKVLKYATLSYRWGKSVPTQLSSSNIADFRKTVPFLNLPLTLQQAIVLCSLLGFHYIWIDALCIVQDDKTDWERESVRMYNVYTGSAVNIAATASSDCTQGLIPKGNGLAPCHVETRWKSTEQPLSCTIMSHGTTYMNTVETGTLNSRGWVFQERVLSPRTIHFCQDQIWYDCRCAVYMESLGFDTPITQAEFVDPIHGSNVPAYSDISSMSWRFAVLRYELTALTYPSDRLAAFAGIAQAYVTAHNLNPDEYVAGWLRSELFYGLTWFILRHRKRARTGIAPTWSWASVTTGSHQSSMNWVYSYPEMEARVMADKHTKFEIVDVSLHSNPETPFHHTRKGALRLRGTIRKLEVFKAVELDQERVYRDSDGLEMRSNNRTWLHAIRVHEPYKRPQSEDTIEFEGLRTMLDLDPQDLEGSQLYIMPMCANNPGFSGLLLQKMSGLRGTYERCGWASSENENISQRPAWWRSGDELDDTEFFEKHDDEVYTIEII